MSPARRRPRARPVSSARAPAAPTGHRYSTPQLLTLLGLAVGPCDDRADEAMRAAHARGAGWVRENPRRAARVLELAVERRLLGQTSSSTRPWIVVDPKALLRELVREVRRG